jgi:hypothetical protein
MGALFHCSSVHYAIIQASSVHHQPERLVIAYPGEDCLRDLIAGASIIGYGFASRAEALASLKSGLPDATTWKQKRRSFRSACKKFAAGWRLEEIRRMAFRTLQWAFSTAIILLYSRNALGAMIRVALGVPF